MNRDDVQGWLDRYVEAWRANEAERIRDLFSEDVEYAYNPWDEPISGRETVVKDWLENPDPPDSFQASYEPVTVEGTTAVAAGWSRYQPSERTPQERLYYNVFLIRFAPDGRCKEFREWYMKRPPEPATA